MKNDSPFLKRPTEPFRVEPGLGAHDVLARMERISFQGRNLALAYRLWQRMLQDEVVIFLGLAGALTAGGLRLLVAWLVEHRFVDCIVTTGANLYHDLHETRGRHHYMGTPRVDDADLQDARIDRVYDTYALEDEFVENDNWIAALALELEPRRYTSREFLNVLGRRLWEETGGEGILTAAYRAGVPIYCPAIADSSIGMGLAQARHESADAGQVDVIADVVESSNLVMESPATASIVFGGGTPKNFINQAMVEAEFYNPDVNGHKYALQIITDAPHFGGASGSTLDEAKSWGKVASEAKPVTVHADATLATPLLVSALATTAGALAARRTRPPFDPSGRVLRIGDREIASERFREK